MFAKITLFCVLLAGLIFASEIVNKKSGVLSHRNFYDCNSNKKEIKTFINESHMEVFQMRASFTAFKETFENYSKDIEKGAHITSFGINIFEIHTHMGFHIYQSRAFLRKLEDIKARAEQTMESDENDLKILDATIEVARKLKLEVSKYKEYIEDKIDDLSYLNENNQNIFYEICRTQ